jgi:Uma2 family endonuclease
VSRPGEFVTEEVTVSAVATPAIPAGPTPDFQPSIGVGQCVVLDDVDWPVYEAIGEALRDRSHIRLTYDRGRLEIMTLSHEHERLKYVIGRLIDVLAEECDLPIAGFGSPTYKQNPDRGLEPDQCYYCRNYERVRGLTRIDLRRDPPPDLAVEIDVTHSSIPRMALYVALGVPEVWRFAENAFRYYLLGADGQYAEVDQGLAFPAVPAAALAPFVRLGMSDIDRVMVRAIRDWVRGQSENT